jgi:hypothetical protein
MLSDTNKCFDNRIPWPELRKGALLDNVIRGLSDSMIIFKGLNNEKNPARGWL